eukprot:322711-Hanusia_phi.AAC.2
MMTGVLGSDRTCQASEFRPGFSQPVVPSRGFKCRGRRMAVNFGSKETTQVELRLSGSSDLSLSGFRVRSLGFWRSLSRFTNAASVTSFSSPQGFICLLSAAIRFKGRGPGPIGSGPVSCGRFPSFKSTTKVLDRVFTVGFKFEQPSQ